MDRSSPVSHSESMGGASSPASSAGHAEDAANHPADQANSANLPMATAADVVRKRKASRKNKRLPTAMRAKVAEDEDVAAAPTQEGGPRKLKKQKLKRKDKEGGLEGREGRLAKKARKQHRVKIAVPEGSGLTAAQVAVNEQMRRALEEDQYSANGSIVDTDSDDDDLQYTYKGQSVRLDRSYLVQAARKHLWLERHNATVLSSTGSTASAIAISKDAATSVADGEDADSRPSRGSGSSAAAAAAAANKKKKKGKRGKDELGGKPGDSDASGSNVMSASSNASGGDNEFERDEGSIFGQTTGQSNSTWVECDKCKKWRRLRGVVDERKLPPKWYCSMNKNDPERSRCSAPEEEYDAATTPESAADARTRKHIRVWCRRLQSNEAYEARQPTLTRNKKRQNTTSSKEPYEWIRCCNPSCGKWRVLLKSMDAKSHVMDRATDGEWYCVMNTWDEKVASCAAPQENLPAVGCPPWVMQGDN